MFAIRRYLSLKVKVDKVPEILAGSIFFATGSRDLPFPKMF